MPDIAAADVSLALTVLALGFAVSVLSGLLGIGGGIVMAPALLYLPPALGIGGFDMRQVTGLTITQGLFACLSGAMRHDKFAFVHRRLVGWMGGALFVSAFAGSLLSSRVGNDTLKLVFVGLAVLATMLMWLPKDDGLHTPDARSHPFNVPLAVGIALAVGLLGGLVGQGGSFILIPLLLYALRLPTRVAIGSNLALVFCASLAGFAGKVATGQVLFLPAAAIVLGALPGAQLGSIMSRRTPPKRLRVALAFVVACAALGMSLDVLRGGR